MVSVDKGIRKYSAHSNQLSAISNQQSAISSQLSAHSSQLSAYGQWAFTQTFNSHASLSILNSPVPLAWP
ncbi:hypothetical protein LYNGBM3L_40830 [Moorena producens 3L]|uniref:Uncharacterized protein n=1 Tax=Moorena producens 3L TaxID=489825 RepID=F4XVS1_9CYAN|nr:hypothetical protein LYNGBM3L_40830 [Moorena producens 3L]OLT66967.1 hypothetical protein BI334_19900 [Moorena producens 3L]